MEASLFLWTGSSIAQYGLNWTRHAYRECPKFREAIQDAGSFGATDPTPQEKERVMRKLFGTFPSTVSEMIHEQTQPHGMIFKACMMAGCVLSLRADMGALTPTPDSDAQKILNVLRSTAFFCGGFLMSLAPSPHFAFELFERHAREGTKKLDTEEADQVRIVMQQNTLHAVAAMTAFMLTPVVESVAVGIAAQRFAQGQEGWVALCDLRSACWPPSRLACASGLFGLFLPLRALNIFTTFFSLKKMTGYFGTSFLRAPQKCFWAEFALCVSAIRTFQLAACASWFVDRSAVSARSGPIFLGFSALALNSAWQALRHNFRTLALLSRDLEYSAPDYGRAYDEWKAESDKNSKAGAESVAAYEKLLGTAGS